MKSEQGLLPLDLPPPLTRRQMDLLRELASDIQKFGRIRTSTEVHKDNTQARGKRIAMLQSLERIGVVARDDLSWSTGRITPAGMRVLAQRGSPRARTVIAPFPKGVAKSGGTKYPSMLRSVDDSTVLSPGANNGKLGAQVRKGPHRGKRIYAVTLEEEDTCPKECTLMDRCYGGSMPFARRLRWEDGKTDVAIAHAIEEKPNAMIRLHTLGDFPSTMYVDGVLEALRYAGSASFGFTHHQRSTEIGRHIARLARVNWGIFAIRTSYEHGTRKPIPLRSAVIIEHPDQAKQHNAVICPEQLGKVKNCGSCGYCWHTQRPVAFLLHEVKRRLNKK